MMTKTITLTDLIVDYIHIDYENQKVLVGYRMVDSNGVKWEEGTAVFWVTIPAEPSIYDFQLPSGYISTLIQLKDDADLAITNKFLV